jgi:hypothetical protein
MAFRLSKDHRSWFQGISKEFKIKLDMYYLCLMMGIAANHKSEMPDAGELLDYWADKYSDYSNFIIGLILFVEAKNIGIDINDKELTSQHLNNFIDPNSISKLSLEKGFKEANRYANGGCEIMMTKIPTPNLLGEFLIKYQEILKEELKNNKNFNFN